MSSHYVNVRKSKPRQPIAEITFSPAKKKPKRKNRPPTAKKAPASDSITVAIGPADSGAPANTWITDWMTFPLTPGSLPVAVAGLWQDNQLVSGGTRSVYGGPDNDTITFSGQLEPPAAYIKSSLAQSIESYEWGRISATNLKTVPDPSGQADAMMVINQVGQPTLLDPKQEVNLSNNPPARGGTLLPPPSSNTGVMMMDGAVAGYGTFVDPLEFKELLVQACLAGEIFRMVIGDEYGYNSLVTLRTFAWRYEDPDPETLYYDLSAKSQTIQVALSALGQSTKQKTGTVKDTWWTVRDGNTLRDVATKSGLGSDSKAIATLTSLNLSALANLWVYPDPRYTPRESAGPRSPPPAGTLVSAGHAYGKSSASHFNPDMALRHGFRLRLKKSGK